MDEDLLQQLNSQQLALALKKAQGELEVLLAIEATKRDATQRTRFAQLVGTSDKPGFIKSLKARHDQVKAEEDVENTARQQSEAIKAWLGTPVNPVPHSGEGGLATGAQARIDSVRPTIKSVGEMVVLSEPFQKNFDAIKAGGSVSFQLKADEIIKLVGSGGLKTVLSTGAGYQPNRIRLGTDKDVEYMTRPPRVRELIPMTTNAQYRISWMEQTTRTNNAAAKAEGTAAGENAYAWTERTADAVTIPAILPVTEQQLKTVPQIEKIITRMLMEDVVKIEEDYILTGNSGASPPQLPGILNHGSILSIGVGTDAKEIKLAKAITLIQTRAGRYRNPTAIVVHPNDMLSIRTTKDSQGRYILAHPLISTQMNWTVPIIESVAITEGTALVGDFDRGVEIHRVDEVGVEFGWNNDNYGKLLRTARCYLIESMAIYMGDAFCSVNFATS